MPKFKFPEFRVADTPGEPNGGGPRAPGTAPRALGGGGMARKLIGVLLILAMVYACYFWLVRRVVVGPNQVLVLLRKDGTRSLPTDEVIVPRPPDQKAEPEKFQKWKERYGDCNGILEQVYLPG